MPKLLALGGPRDGRLVHIDDPEQETSFELQPPLPTQDPTTAHYRRARLPGGTEVLVSADLPADADLDALHAKAQAASREHDPWADD